MEAVIGSIIVAIIGLIGGLVTSNQNRQSVASTNAANKAMQDSANATNIQIAEAANALQREESEKAYERSKAGNQVNLMQLAGMSRAGAINALQGGGSYTPAPVNTAQVHASTSQAYQRDPSAMNGILSSLMGSFSNAGQIKQARKELEAQREMHTETLESQERIAANKVAADKDMQEKELSIKRQEQANKDYEIALSKLSHEMQNAASSLSRNADPNDYETPYAYRKALYESATEKQRSYFDNSEFTKAIDLYHAANQTSRNVSVNIEHTKEDTKRIKQITTKLKAEFDEWNSITNKESRAAEAQARKVHAELQNLADSYDYKITYQDYLAWSNYDSADLSAKANRFWTEATKVLPIRAIGDILRVIKRK